MIHIVVEEKILKAVGKSTARRITHEESINRPVTKLGMTLKIQKMLAVTNEASTTIPACERPTGAGIKNAMITPNMIPIIPLISLVCFMITNPP
jgi:hypothetical protein